MRGVHILMWVGSAAVRESSRSSGRDPRPLRYWFPPKWKINHLLPTDENRIKRHEASRPM